MARETRKLLTRMRQWRSRRVRVPMMKGSGVPPQGKRGFAGVQAECANPVLFERARKVRAQAPCRRSAWVVSDACFSLRPRLSKYSRRSDRPEFRLALSDIECWRGRLPKRYTPWTRETPSSCDWLCRRRHSAPCSRRQSRAALIAPRPVSAETAPETAANSREVDFEDDNDPAPGEDGSFARTASLTPL